MRIVATLSLKSIKLEKKDRPLREYLHSKLEELYLHLYSRGKLSKDALINYSSALEALKAGNARLFWKYFQSLSFQLDREKTKWEEFDYVPPCTDCALISIYEGEFVIKAFNKNTGIFKKFFYYDANGRLLPAGIIIDVKTLRETFEKTFIAVA